MKKLVYSAVDVWEGVDKVSPGVDCSVEESVTQQNFKDETDINKIMAKYEKGIGSDFVNQNQPRFGDFDNVDFHEAMNIVAVGNSMFEAMPAEQRKAFDNDPRKFFDAIHDPDQQAKLVKLGLVKPPELVPPANAAGTIQGAAGGPNGPGAA